MADCIFCKIIAGQIPSEKVFENEHLIAIRDIHPAAPVHVLIIPKQHIPTLNDITSAPAELIASLMQAAREIARKEGIADEGYRVVINCNPAAGQVVFHLHVHVLGGRTLRAMG